MHGCKLADRDVVEGALADLEELKQEGIQRLYLGWAAGLGHLLFEAACEVCALGGGWLELELPKIAEEPKVICAVVEGVLEDSEEELRRLIAYMRRADPALEAAGRVVRGELEAGEEDARELLKYLEELLGRFGWEPVFIAYGYRLRCRVALEALRIWLRDPGEALEAWRAGYGRWEGKLGQLIKEEKRLEELALSRRPLPAVLDVREVLAVSARGSEHLL
ncbi:MAG: hypothetical protein DRN96_06440 [Thermoproteota archaeon]|nr:MAG: hypothetical protein DRN96_06440 [Candidatus Korarchaeota archaeon]